MDDNWIPIIAIVFSLSIPIVSIIAGLVSRKYRMRVLEKAIEKGISLEGFSFDERKAPQAPYRAGMIIVAVGIGIGIFAVLVGQIAKEAFYPLLGLGSIPLLVGIALIINDKINYDKLFTKELDSQ